ncbi:MAG: hypothetical protein JNK63_06230 [Chthonomonas sp.]|nr:hypothetical protein [Chthonomonas sp.]
MRLNVVTTSLLIFGVLLLLCWPIALGGRPSPDAPRAELANWGARALTYFLLTSMAFLSAAFGAVLIMRRNRREFLVEAKQNVRDLIEGSLKDHEKPDA